jgi:ATP-dependent helicase Lhr and Lhr-like helicase
VQRPCHPHEELRPLTAPLSPTPALPYPSPMLLPDTLTHWFTAQGWALHPHQSDMLARADDPATLLIAPTGGGKTMAGFLPTLAELAGGNDGLHTLYISPLKALSADIARNLRAPVAGAGLPITIEDRTGDTPAHIRARQRVRPPNILLTTPESLALMLSYPDAARIFGTLRRVVVDELHALAESKRGDQLMLLITRLAAIAPNLRRVGLSATTHDPAGLAAYLGADCGLIIAPAGPAPDIALLPTRAPPPWAGGGGHYAIPDILAQVAAHQTTLIFHNTRAQAEIFFHKLWLANEDNLPIGIHHGSLAREARQKVEAAMAAGDLRAVVCTGSLDLGLDWGAVDLVIQVGAPRSVKRLVQRIGRANHRYNTPSKARLVPANRFEIIESVAALQAAKAGDLDGAPQPSGALDVLCQHILICACAAPFEPTALFDQVRRAGPYAQLSRAAFDDCLDFVATGGYALRSYDQWQRLMLRGEMWGLRDPRSAALIRQNLGTITDADRVPVRLRAMRGKGTGGAPLGEVEEAFAATLTRGDTFLIGGQIVRFEGLDERAVSVARSSARTPRVPVFSGGKFASTLQLAQRVAGLIANPAALPADARDWVGLQADASHLPQMDRLLIECFPHDDQVFHAIYGFAGQNAQATLGLLLTKTMEAAGLDPLGYLAADHATLIWGLGAMTDPAALLDSTALQGGLETWLAQTAVMKRAFRASATITGLTPRSHNGARKSGRAVTFSTDILYETLRKYDPDHLLLRITRAEAARGLVDFARLEEMLERVGPRIDLVHLPRPSPFAAPLLLERGRVPIMGEGRAKLAEDEARELMRAAGLS